MATEEKQSLVLKSSWSSNTLDPGRIHDESNRLWAELGGPPAGGQAPGEMIAESNAGGGGLMRANTLNLLAVAHSPEETSFVVETVSRLRDFLPSRTIVLIPTSSEGKTDTPFQISVELMKQNDKDNPSPLRFEIIKAEAPADDVGELASFVSPMLVAELPDFLWWPGGEFSRDPLFQELSEVADRVIVDSARLGREGAGILALRDLMGQDEKAGPFLGDFTWLRLAPWRQLIAQFFDPPDVQESLATIEDITITYADTRSDGSSGFASALLVVGWLASRLDWEIIEPLERRRNGSWSAPLRAPKATGRKEISLRLVPDKSPHARFSLRMVEILAGGEAPGSFKIERTDQDDLVTTSETRTVPKVSRMVYARRPSNETMLLEELQRFGHERIFEEALGLATHLLP